MELDPHTLSAAPFQSELVIDPALVRKYGGAGPRYTSYPTADRFVEAYDAEAYAHGLRNRRVGGLGKPFSLYVHLPFCESICYYCACNKVVTRDRGKAATYLDYLAREIALVSKEMGSDRSVRQMHWGGGTPTFLDDSQIESLVGTLRQAFDLDPWGEYAIEIDPRRVSPERIAMLGALGFNRVSFGVQDFEPEVQRAVHRIQSYDQTQRLVTAARDHGFRSVNVDLIYGLPKQTLEGFQRTLHRVLACDPDRIALYAYAHLPTVFKPQRRILEADLPSPEVKLSILTTAIRFLEKAGYVYIGMDHFAKPGDELSLAQREGRLTRNFQGYSAAGDMDIIGLGVSAIGKLARAYSQNQKDLPDYYTRLDAGQLPVMRGIELTADDLVRRAVIESLACNFRVSKESISIAYLLDFDRYFATECRELAAMQKEGLVTVDDEWVAVTPRGRLIVRAICKVFDRHLRQGHSQATYSKVV